MQYLSLGVFGDCIIWKLLLSEPVV